MVTGGAGRGETKGHGDGGVYRILREEVYEAARYGEREGLIDLFEL